MKLVLVLVGLAAAQMESSWIDDFDPESAYLSIISVRKDIEAVNETTILDDDEEDLTSSTESEDMAPPPPPPPPPSGRGRRPGPPRPPGPQFERCGAWGPWEQAKCFWPDQSLDKLPKSCVAIPTKPEWPSWMKKFVASKTMEKYNMLMDEYKARGAPPKCGFCSRSFECRIRNDTATPRRFCPMKEVRPLFDTDCDDKKACEVSQEKGGCPPPLFLGGGRRERLQMMITNGNHEGFSSELYKMRMMDDASQGGRQKRQADFSSYDDASAASFMPFEPQFDFPYEGRAGGRNNNNAGPMGFAPNTDSYDGFREGRRGQQSGRGRGDKRKKNGRGDGRKGEGRRGRPDERPNDDFFGPAADMPRFDQPFGRMPPPPGSGVRPPFFQSDFPAGPVGRGSFPSGPPPPGMQFPPRQPFGPGPNQLPFGGFPQRQPFGPGPSRQPSFGPGPNPPPFGPGPNRPSFGPGQFQPPSFGPNPSPFGAVPSNDAPFPFSGNMGDGRGPRGGRQAPFFNQRPNPFQSRQQGYGPGMSAAPRFSMFMNRGRGMSFPNDVPMWQRRPFGPPPPHHRFLMELFHGTTCASNGMSCLCCCGHYIPNVETGACEDLKQLLPGIDKMVENVDRENQKPSGRPQSPPSFRQMKKMSKKFGHF